MDPREIHGQFSDEETDSETEITSFFMATFKHVISLSNKIMVITTFFMVKSDHM